MSGILDHLGKLSKHVKILQTARQGLDGLDEDNLAYDDKEQVPDKGKIVEPTRKNGEKGIELPLRKIMEAPEPIFKYFLDGSRRTYKVADLSWNKGFYPLIAGQIVVACCHRPDAYSFRKEILTHKSVLSVPEVLDAHDGGANYYAYARDELNKAISRDAFFRHAHEKMSIGIDEILSYKTGQRREGADRRNDFLNRAIAAIQGTMTNLEQETVVRLCDEGKLNSNNWLIKDGSLEYNPSYSYGKRYSFSTVGRISTVQLAQILRHRENFGSVPFLRCGSIQQNPTSLVAWWELILWIFASFFGLLAQSPKSIKRFRYCRIYQII